MGTAFAASCVSPPLVCVSCPSRLAQRFEDVGVRAQGMAGAFVAVADDATATWWNPAGLATARTCVDRTVIARGQPRAGRRGGVRSRFPSLGLSYYRLKISQIQPSGSTAADGVRADKIRGLQDSSGATVRSTRSPGHLVVATTVKLVNARGDTQGAISTSAQWRRLGWFASELTVRDLRESDVRHRRRCGGAWSGARERVLPSWPRQHGALERLVVAADADLNTTAGTTAAKNGM